ncbi:MAG: FeoA domain-containing protein [Atribacterota bacterium]|nr:FeoA domain-containing protein [Atribacterota bacterium]
MICKLSDKKNNEKLVLINIRGGYGVYHKLLDMGLVPGVTFEVCHNHGLGPIAISLKGTKLMLGRELAEKLIVKEEKKDGNDQGCINRKS